MRDLRTAMKTALAAAALFLTAQPAGAQTFGNPVNLVQVGGKAITLGVKPSTGSVPVVMASDGAPIPVTGSLSVNISSGLATLQSVQISITVAGGAGQTLFTATGTISGCSMIPANDAAQYDFAMTAAGSDEYPVTGKSGIIGRVFLATRRDLLGDYWAKIYNATHDGAYKVRCIAVK